MKQFFFFGISDRYIRGFCFAFEAKKKWRSWRSTWPELCTKHKPFHFHFAEDDKDLILG
ncbi:unnamed protein product [Brassica oleracea var. botrytis]|uniref:(rape) hypothetical protein n=1 Tax=Brassica napus TaxID=3708 RepID=A0A816J888_BRANA|nr:unnamed protein product [Brassica napus]